MLEINKKQEGKLALLILANISLIILIGIIVAVFIIDWVHYSNINLDCQLRKEKEQTR